MHKTTIFIIQLYVVIKLFGFEDACGFMLKTASFMVESSVGMCKIKTL